jgi:hypothetical protein
MAKATPEAPAKNRRPKSEPWQKHLEAIEQSQREVESLRLEMRMDYAQRVELDALGDRVTHLETQSDVKRSEHSGTFILALIATGSITVIIGCLVAAVFRLDYRMDTQTRKTNWMGDEIIQQRNAYPLPSPVQPSPPAP